MPEAHSHELEQVAPIALSDEQLPVPEQKPVDLQAFEQVPPLHVVLHAPEPLHVYAPQPLSGSVPAA